MDGVRTYFLGVVAAAMLSVLATALVRDKKLKGIIGFTSGILIMLVVAKPLLNLNSESILRGLKRAEGKFSFDANQITQESNRLLKELIKENTETYIEDKGRELGAVVQAEVLVKDGENPEPYKVTLVGTLEPSQVRELGEYIHNSLGIPPENQEWKLYG